MSTDSPKTFAGVVAGEVPVVKVREDAFHLAFLAPRPQVPGHVIVIPKQVHDSWLELDARAAAALWEFAREVGLLLRERLPCARVCVTVIGWELRHAHIHLLPTTAAGQVPGLPGTETPVESLQAIAARLRD
jgi:histidine triad (HIT) family protein